MAEAVGRYSNMSNMCSLPSPPNDLSDHPVDVGQRTEAIVLAELVRRGYRVLTPFGTNQRYDLAIDLGDRFLRAQCKTGRLRRGTIIFHPRSVRSNTR
jgi:PD-(D/E)XK nuclease superfamily protein